MQELLADYWVHIVIGVVAGLILGGVIMYFSNR